MDALDDILDTLDLRGALYFRTDFSPPWAIAVPRYEQAARFHLVIQGVCHVEVSDGEWVMLSAGDMILIPAGRGHVLADPPAAAAPALETVLKDAGFEGRGALVLGEGDPQAATQMVCGHFTFIEGADHPILRALPEHLVVRAADRARDAWLDDLLRLISRRILPGDLGSTAAVTRLSEIVFIEALRSGLDSGGALAGVMAAFRDPQIGKALSLMHQRPAEPWTVEGLAAEIGMSRSRFADRFSAALGEGPMSYLAEWRLQKALSLLSRSRMSVQQVAAMTGYQSPAAFSRAFSARFGVPPTDYRRSSDR